MDADGSHPAEAIPQMLGTALSTGAGLVVGSRYVPGGELADEWGWRRRRCRGGPTPTPAPSSPPVSGTSPQASTCGARRPSARSTWPRWRGAGYSFQVELKFRAVHAGFSAMEVPIRFEERRAGESKMSFAVQLESALVPWRLRLRARKHKR